VFYKIFYNDFNYLISLYYEAVMKLLKLYSKKVLGAISGLDRIRFRGTIRWLANENGIEAFMHKSGVLLKDFKNWAIARNELLCRSCEEQAKHYGIETIYLRSGAIDKEKFVREYAKSHGKKSGPICMLSVVEPCISPMVSGK
jgi:hypothetical protein